MTSWLTDHERVRNITASIQSLVLIVAVGVGGFWTASTFAVLGEVQKASLENQRLRADLADQERKVANGLGIGIDARQQQEGDAVSALIKITNRSTRHRSIDFATAPLHVWRIDFDQNGNSTREHVLEQANLTAGSRVLRSGETVDYLYFFKAPQKGLYLLTFLIKLTPDELKIHRESGGPSGDDIYWDGMTYIVVR